MSDDPAAAAVVAALHARNRAGAAALRATRSLVEAETRASELQRTLDKQQRGTTLLVKTKHDMEADLELLKANEANQGVSREHIQMLQEQLAGAKTEASIAADEAQKARATEKLTEDGARALAEKVAARELELAEAREEAAELRRAAERASAKQADLQKENERLVQRLLEAQLSMAQALDSEVSASDERIRRDSSPQIAPPPAASPAAAPAAPG
jgi:hypothetical protein